MTRYAIDLPGTRYLGSVAADVVDHDHVIVEDPRVAFRAVDPRLVSLGAWADCDSMDQAILLLDRGDDRGVARSRALSAELSATLRSPGDARLPGHSPAGGALRIPRVLAGHPAPYARQVIQHDPDRGELLLLLDLWVECGISARAVQARAWGMLALAQYLAKDRPVRVVGVLGGYVRDYFRHLLLEIPLYASGTVAHWGRVAALAGTATGIRVISYGIQRALSGHKGGGHLGTSYTKDRVGEAYLHEPLIRAVARGATNICYIPAVTSTGYAGSVSALLESDPIGWVIEQYSQLIEERQSQ